MIKPQVVLSPHPNSCKIGSLQNKTKILAPAISAAQKPSPRGFGERKNVSVEGSKQTLPSRYAGSSVSQLTILQESNH